MTSVYNRSFLEWFGDETRLILSNGVMVGRVRPGWFKSNGEPMFVLLHRDKQEVTQIPWHSIVRWEILKQAEEPDGSDL